jgi:hypothetical protein
MATAIFIGERAQQPQFFLRFELERERIRQLF